MTLSVQHFNKHITWWPLALLLTLIAAQPAFAQQEIRYPQLLEHGGKQFASYVNEITEMPTWIIDTDSLDFTLGASLSLFTKSGVQTAADAFVESAKDLFGTDPKQLAGPTISTNGTLWFISYQQVYSDLHVLGAKLGLTVTRTGRLLAAGARLFPKVVVNTAPTLSASAAMAAATGHAFVPDADVSAKDELVILPVEEDGVYVYGLAWEITVSNHDLKPPVSKTYLVDAHSGKILHERSNIYHGHSNQPEPVQIKETATPMRQSVQLADDQMVPAATECPSGVGANHKIEGRIALNYYESPDDSLQALRRIMGADFSYAKYSVSGPDGFKCEDYADNDGNYSAGLPNSATYTITFHMATDSTFVKGITGLTLAHDCMEKTSFTIAVDGHEQLDYDWGWGISGDGGLSSFGLNGVFNARELRDYFRDTHKTDRPDKVVGVYVSLADGGANSDAGRSELTIGGAAAMSNELIMHEYSHLIVDVLVGEGFTPMFEAVQEAASDFFAADATDNSLFSGPAPEPGDDPALDAADGDLREYMRDLNNTCTMAGECLTTRPDEVGFNRGPYPYELSRTLSGAIWTLRGQLGDVQGAKRASQLFYAALVMDPDPEIFIKVAEHMIAASKDSREPDDTVEIDAMKLEFGRRGILEPDMPRSLAVSCEASSLVVTWSDEASTEAGYEIERRTGDGPWQTVKRFDMADIVRFEDTGASCGETTDPSYSYRVAAYGTFGPANADTLRAFSVVAGYSTSSDQSQARASRLVVPEEIHSEEPATFETELRSVYPNPFNPVTTVSYALKEEDHVSLVVYDVLGRRVAVLVDGVQAAGEHSIAFEATRLPSGSYFVRMETSAYRRNRMVLLAK